MRSMVRDVIREPSAIVGWWEDWPVRTRRFWSVLLFDKGQGWLRWGTDTRTEYDYIGEGLEQLVDYVVAPPLRRVWWFLSGNVKGLWAMVVGVQHPVHQPERWRPSWEEAVCSFSDCWGWYIDKDRYEELWGIPKSWVKRKRR